MELRHLRYFVTVAEEHNISRAALILRVAQPSLSRQLSDLENEVGVPLMERGRHGVRLTAAGREFHRRAKVLLAEARQATEAARQAGGAMAGRLAIGFLSALQLDHLLPVVRAFRAENAQVDLTFSHATHEAQIAALQDGDLDIAFLDLSQPPAGCDHAVIWRIPFEVVMPEDHPLAKRKTVKLRDLSGENFVFCTREARPVFHDAYFRLCANAGFRPHVVQEVGGYPSTMLALVAMGVGLSVLPRFERAENIRGIVWCPLADQQFWIDFSLIWSRVSPPPPVQAFTSLARRMLPVTGPARGAVIEL